MNKFIFFENSKKAFTYYAKSFSYKTKNIGYKTIKCQNGYYKKYLHNRTRTKSNVVKPAANRNINFKSFPTKSKSSWF